MIVCVTIVSAAKGETEMKKIQIRTFLAALTGICALSVATVKTCADGLPVETDLGDEYDMMQNGTWPTEVTFADTVFTNEWFAVSTSVLKQLNGQPTEDHTFTLKAGDRVDFALKGSIYPAKDYYDSIIQWHGSSQNSVYGMGFGSEGVYVFERNKDSYYLEVSDFGFENDLSDLSGHAVMELSFPAVRVMDEDEYLSYDSQQIYGTFKDAFNQAKENRPHADIIQIRAEGDITIEPFTPGRAYNYLGGIGSMDTTPQESDSVGFCFVFGEETQFEVSLNNGISRPVDAHVDYYSIGQYDLGETSWQQTKDQEVITYITPAIVLVGSDLVERSETVVDEWEQKHAPQKTPEPEKSGEAEQQSETSAEQPAAPAEQSETRPASSGMSPVILIGGLAAIAAAGFFLLKKKK